MKFFVPGFRGEREMAEHVWLTVRSWLSENGLETTRRRIAAVVAEIDGADHFIAVDHETPFGDLAILILESSDRARFHTCPERSRRVCTLERGVGEGTPWTLPLDENWRVVDFE